LYPRYVSYADGDFNDVAAVLRKMISHLKAVKFLNIKAEDVEDTPTFGTKLETDYILGMAKMEG
jgi:hypothetical protein